MFLREKNQWDIILKFKAQYVVNSFKQQKNLDYIDIFDSIVNLMFWKTMMSISAKNDYKIHQVNIIIVFLHKFFDKEIYIIRYTKFDDGIIHICLL